MRERYVIREVTGYGSLSNNNGTAREGTDVMVLDTWACWRVVAYFPAHTKMVGLPTRRHRARELIEALNAAGDA